MPRAGSSSSLRIVTATPVSADSLSHCRPITAGSEPSSSAAGVSSAAIARASARFSGAVRRISSTCRLAAVVSLSSSGSMACASATMLVNPCACV
jgi:hypothetical protein